MNDRGLSEKQGKGHVAYAAGGAGKSVKTGRYARHRCADGVEEGENGRLDSVQQAGFWAKRGGELSLSPFSRGLSNLTLVH